MPFLTYSIKPETVENYENLKLDNVLKFLNYIDLLNYKGRAILINKNDNTLQKLTKKYFDNANNISSLKQDLANETLQSFVRTLNDSLQIQKRKDDIKIDFEKDTNNEIKKELFNEFNNDVFNPSLYNFSLNKFNENFLEKIKAFILSKNLENKSLNSLFIFHKEASKYLEGWPTPHKPYNPVSQKKIEERMKDPNENRFYFKNVMKIKSGLNVLTNWWKNIPDEYRPENFIFLTDTPTKSYKYNVEKKQDMTKFLFENLDTKKYKAKLEFLVSQELTKQWWKHKRHFVFGSDASLIIDSEFGIEFVDENNPSRLNNNKFVVISDADNVHVSDIKQETAKYT